MEDTARTDASKKCNIKIVGRIGRSRENQTEKYRKCQNS